jgi:hypothetical protein
VKPIFVEARELRPGDLYDARIVADVRHYFHRVLIVFRDGHTRYVGDDTWVSALRKDGNGSTADD